MIKGLLAKIAAVLVALTTWLSVANTQATRATQENGRDEANNTETHILVGKVTVEGGSAQLPDTTVVLECNGYEQVRVNTTIDGSFVLSRNSIQTSSSGASTQHGGSEMSSVGACVLYADAAGYTSERLYLETPAPEMAEVPTIVLHPLSRRLKEGATVSVGSLAAPEKARQAFEKGQRESKKGNWKAACEYFRRAVDIYPRYAVAWLQLGRAQLQQHELVGAQQSFQRATIEDSHLIAGYIELAELGAKQKDWSVVASTTDHVLQVAQDLSPKVWFLNSAAKFNMGDVVGSENSVKRGLQLDLRHEVPQLEYLYGIVLARQGQYGLAVEHITAYLRLAPHAADLETAETALSKIKQLASAIPQQSSR